MLALGSWSAPGGSETAEADMRLAEQLMQTCYDMYAHTPVGLAPERVFFDKNDFRVPNEAPWSVHRPETVESLYILWVTTGKTKYRDWGWAIFEALERCCKTRYGYGAHPDVRRKDVKCCEGNDDRTETYFFAETLKYMWLLFSDRDSDRIKKFVFNTEAHPFQIRGVEQDKGSGFELFS